jgi:hypothetical protein
MNGEEENFLQDFGGETGKRDHLINLIIEENMLSKWISVKYDGDVD